ncbi:hypothetical protein T492DRAFT_879360, partial [Pavlovales sp. CCMP2436]
MWGRRHSALAGEGVVGAAARAAHARYKVPLADAALALLAPLSKWHGPSDRRGGPRTPIRVSAFDNAVRAAAHAAERADDASAGVRARVYAAMLALLSCARAAAASVAGAYGGAVRQYGELGGSEYGEAVRRAVRASPRLLELVAADACDVSALQGNQPSADEGQVGAARRAAAGPVAAAAAERAQ